MELSLAQWSIQKLHRGDAPTLDHLDAPAFVRDTFGITALEPVTGFWPKGAGDDYDAKFVAAADKAGVRLANLAIDADGDLGSDDDAARARGVEHNGEWLRRAARLGVKQARCNTGGKTAADPEASLAHAIEGFKQLCDVGKEVGVRVLVENHWGLSKDPAMIARLVQAVRESHGDDAIATLPDFGNWPPEIDRYAALGQVLPYAGAVHAKVHDVSDDGGHEDWDLARCLALTRAEGYDGLLGIEFEGKGEPVEGVRRAVALLRDLV